MKKRVLIWGALVIAAAVGFTVAPRMVESSIPTVYYVTPNLKSYENVINCTGTVQSQTVQEIYLQNTLVASDVFVEIGDVVKEDDILLRIDSQLTENLSGLPISLIRDVTEDATLTSSSNIDWASMASAYGLNAVVNGGSVPEGIDYDLVQEILEQTGVTSSVDSGAFIDSRLVEGEITAPMTGVVTDISIQPGVPSMAGKSIITIADNQNYKVLASIKEEDIAKVQVGDMAKIRGVGFGGSSYTGTVTKIYPTARKTFSGTTSETVIDCEITLDNADKNLKPGLTAKVEISGGSDYNLITVPYEAIKQDENNNEYVYLYNNGKLVKQLVTTGQELTNEVEILDGVSYESVVVYNPSDLVKEGSMIHIKGRAEVD